jgi:hypothetical protein
MRSRNIDAFDATGEEDVSPPPSPQMSISDYEEDDTMDPIYGRVKAKKKPSWYKKERNQKNKPSMGMQDCLEKYIGRHEAFRLEGGPGESVEAVLEEGNVSLLWELERNKFVCTRTPALETTYRRKVVYVHIGLDSDDNSQSRAEF